MAKVCDYPGCTNQRWGGGYCKLPQHQKYRTDYQWEKKHGVTNPDKINKKECIKGQHELEKAFLEQILENTSAITIIPNPIIKPNKQKYIIGADPIKKKRKSISKQSDKGKANTLKIQKIKLKLIEQNGYTCFFTGPCRGRLDAFHIFPKGKYPEYKTESWNIILSTRGMNRIWDQGTWEEILQMPNIHWLLWFIQTKDNDPNKLHQGSFYNQLMERKNK